MAEIAPARDAARGGDAHAARILGCPWNVQPCAVIPLGWPRGRYGPTTRWLVEEVVSADRFGNRAWQSQ